MAKRAVECFRKQTYQNKRLYVYDTGKTPCTDSLPDCFPDFSVIYHRGIDQGLTIGALRNRANWWGIRGASDRDPDADIIVHFDDDDLSHPSRISEQVALLQASGKQCVGYRSVLFLDERNGEAWKYMNNDPRYCIGSSLAYYRATWERKPFKDISRGEDRELLRDIESIGVDSIVDGDPRMVCSIHAGNHVAYQTTSANWTRVPLWDSRLREIMTHA
jgi:glycosyltransferase involved in cell wall biosynthesis